MNLDLSSEVAALRSRAEKAERRAAELALIAELAADLSGSLDLAVIASLVAEMAVTITGVGECSLWLCTDGNKPALISRVVGISASRLPKDLHAQLIDRVARLDCPLTMNHLDPAGIHCSYAALPLRFEDKPVAAMALVGFPNPEHMEEQVATLQQAMPVAALSIQNALTLQANVAVSERLRGALAELQERQVILEAQNEEIRAQNDEIQAQTIEIQAQYEEIQAQSEELQEHNVLLAEQRAGLEEKNVALESAHRELARLYELSQQQEARMHAIVDAATDGVMVVDGERRVIIVNPAFEALTGFPAEQLVGKNCHKLLDCIVSPDRQMCDVNCPFACPAGCHAPSVDAAITTIDGRSVWVNVASGPIYGRDGQPSAVVYAIRDISARKELERQKDEFLSIAAHDLKNPLTAIRGRAQLMSYHLRKEEARPDVQKGLELIDVQVERMLRLTNELLDLTRIQMGRVNLQAELIDLVDLAHRVVDQVQVSSARHSVVFETMIAEVSGHWDHSAVERVIVNLVDNAVKYTPTGGQIKVVTGAIHADSLDRLALLDHPHVTDANWAFVSVYDQGPGISAEDQIHLFERYYRATGTSQVAQGLGLGLYICHGLVEAMGGRIWVDSALGQGSIFHFVIPIN